MRRLHWWYLIPLLSFGAGSGPMVIYGGARLRSRGHIAVGVAYGALFSAFVVGSLVADPNRTGLIDAIIAPAWLISWLAGTVHIALLERAVWVKDRKPREPVDPVLAAAHDRLAKRAQARALLASNPVLAAELLIGRPDLGRQYDDGGLVDINNVSATVLASELGLPADVAEQVSAARDRLGSFSNPDELVIYCTDMTMARLNLIRERLVFLPR
jgi:hypothetical protein